MKISLFLLRIFLYFLIAIALVNFLFGIKVMFRIFSEEKLKNYILVVGLIRVLLLQFAYLVVAIGLLKTRPWAWYAGVSVLGFGMLLEIPNLKDSLATIILIVFYLTIIFLLSKTKSIFIKSQKGCHKKFSFPAFMIK